jgi:hypothetical protein
MTLSPLPPLSGTSIESANFNQTSRIDKVFNLLLNVMQLLQSVAISQSKNLNFLTSWQKAYTTLMSKVPVFVASSSVFGGTDTTASNTRDDMNRINSTYLEQLRSQNSIIGDMAKAMQTNINQVTDMVNQMGSMATAFLSELSTILGTMVR